jgi:cell division protease FtsH
MERTRFFRRPVVWIVLVIIGALALSSLLTRGETYQKVDTSVLFQQLSDGHVKNAVIKDKEQTIEFTLDQKQSFDGKAATDKIQAQVPAAAMDDVYQQITTAKSENHISGTVDTKVTKDSVLLSLLVNLLPIAVIVILLLLFMSQMQGGGSRVLNFGKSKAKLVAKDMPKTTFADVAGADEAVEELHEIKDFLQNPAKYQALGAKIPKGVLLFGQPGTGKTLLARAVAGEAGVPFYSISGSDFVEMFVGVGASRVRDLFDQAKQNAPCIIFVDEIDAVGRQRGAGLGGGHDEREQTLNQLLVEMDGFDARGGIILIAATNRPDILDPALLRPGRFDRQIPVSAPDLMGRKKILEVHSKGKPFAPDVDLHALAKRTVGMSGADLANVINEAALLTARTNGTLINAAALEESVDRVIGGPARKSRIISEKEKKITAYHEGGHALAAWAMPDLEPVYKLTILPRGRTGGHALVVPEDDKQMLTRSEMIARLVFALGGRSAEELVFHEPTTGASGDIEQATKIAKAMVTEYGMSARLGAVKYGQEHGDPFLGRSMGHAVDYSLEVAHEIDEEVRALIEAAHTEAWDVLNTYRDVLDDLVIELLEKETLTRKDLARIFSNVEKRPRITAFNEFGGRTPSDKPPIKTPGELAKERGEPWPPIKEEPTPAPVGAAPGGGDLPGGPPRPAPVPPGGGNGAGPNGVLPPPPQYGGPPPLYPPPPGQEANAPRHAGRGGGSAGPPNYGAPPGWTPATTPSGHPNNQRQPSWDQRRGQSDEEQGRERGSEWDSGR